MIVRSNPDVGSFAEEVHERFAFTQTIRAGNLLFLSGVTPLRGGLADLELVGEGDLRAQVEQVLDVLRRALAEEGATFHNLVAETVYTTDIGRLVEVSDVFPAAFGPDAPTATWLEVNRLFHPNQMIEISGIAVLE
jgi:enamine deaminase RidA (YjgF/YER057c/UK114 family)